MKKIILIIGIISLISGNVFAQSSLRAGQWTSNFSDKFVITGYGGKVVAEVWLVPNTDIISANGANYTQSDYKIIVSAKEYCTVKVFFNQKKSNSNNSNVFDERDYYEIPCEDYCDGVSHVAKRVITYGTTWTEINTVPYEWTAALR